MRHAARFAALVGKYRQALRPPAVVVIPPCAGNGAGGTWTELVPYNEKRLETLREER